MIVPSPEVKVFYVAGLAAFVRRGEGTVASESSGSLVFEELREDYVRVKMDLVMETRPAREDSISGVHKTVTIKNEYIFAYLPVERLTPWLGKCDPSLDKAVYP